jgi:hypothetical protein
MQMITVGEGGKHDFVDQLGNPETPHAQFVGAVVPTVLHTTLPL